MGVRKIVVRKPQGIKLAFADHVERLAVRMVVEAVEDEARVFQKLFFCLCDGIVLQPDVHVAVERRLMDDQHVRLPTGRLADDVRRGEHGYGDAGDGLVWIAAFDGVAGFGIVSCRIGPGFKFFDEFCCGNHVCQILL